MRKPNVTESDVLRTSINLINKNGSTSTNVVKESLRKQGFWARQSEVSSAMRKLFTDGELISTDDINRPYQVYTLDVKSFKDKVSDFFGGIKAWISSIFAEAQA